MPTAQALLTRAPFQDRPSLSPFAPMQLTLARVHGVTGPARCLLALAVAAARPGPVLWISPDWSPQKLAGPGISRWMDPGRLVFVSAGREADLLWCFEEALRSGAVPTVVCECPGVVELTPVRRLHLAAEQGMEAGSAPPLPLLLTPEGAAPGVESAWSLAAGHGRSDQDLWQLSRLKARSAPPEDWTLTSQISADDRQTLLQTSPLKLPFDTNRATPAPSAQIS